ncbi:hypothetical protein OG458_42140 (plasmid) [Streptomyces sp. NBC_01281]|uniref:ATP-grasp domain-containing protein n=1 Tax=Streptomyces sp. NBC_01281 TaxID=2903811 RepID=UPI002E15AECA|nr:hypothetical protein OG458_42140 [Streptomyces sp. NBC_01281]
MTTRAPLPDETLKGHLVVLGSGPQAEWDHAFHRLASGGPLLLIDDQPPSWQTSHLAGARTANLLDPSQVLVAAEELARTTAIVGVLNVHAAHSRTAAHLRHELALPGSATTLNAGLLRHRTGQLLAAAGVAHSGSLKVDSYSQALEAAHHVGLPLVCKPACPRTRHAARQVANLADLADVFNGALADTSPGTGALIEPLLDGIEATVYTVDSPEGPRVVAVSHATFDAEAEPALVPVEVVVDADDVCAPAIEDLACRALDALGHRFGPAQIRMRITSEGPQVITISTELIEPLIAMLIEQVTGVDLIAQAGQSARGQTSQSGDVRLGAAAVRFLQGAPDRPLAWEADPRAHVTPYATLHPYPAARRVGPLQRFGHLLVAGADYPQCISRLRTAAAELRPTRLSA